MLEEIRIQTKEKQADNFLMHLKSSMEEKKVVLIYTNVNQTSAFSAGIVSEVSENEVILCCYLPNGKYDGYVVKLITSIFKIETDSKYVKKIQILSKLNKTKHDDLHRASESSFKTLLTYAYETRKVVTIELIGSDNNDAIGLVTSINENYCTMMMINNYGEYDGYSIFRIEDITHISCDGDEEIQLLQLHENIHNINY